MKHPDKGALPAVGDTFSLQEAFERFGLAPPQEAAEKPDKGPLPRAWNVVYTLSAKRVMEQLDDLGVHYFRAMMKTDRVKRHTRRYQNPKKEMVEEPMFPGYMFTAADAVDLKSIDGVVGVLMSSDEHYSRVPNSDIEIIRKEITAGKFDKTKIMREVFKVGTLVRVEDGPFMGFPGVVTQALAGKRARVDVEIFGRPTPVELELTQLSQVKAA